MFFLPRNDASDRFQLGTPCCAFASIFAAFFLLARMLRAVLLGAAAYKSISSRSIMVTTPSSLTQRAAAVHTNLQGLFCLLVLLMPEDGFFICKIDYVGVRVISMR